MSPRNKNWNQNEIHKLKQHLTFISNNCDELKGPTDRSLTRETRKRTHWKGWEILFSRGNLVSANDHTVKELLVGYKLSAVFFIIIIILGNGGDYGKAISFPGLDWMPTAHHSFCFILHNLKESKIWKNCTIGCSVTSYLHCKKKMFINIKC